MIPAAVHLYDGQEGRDWRNTRSTCAHDFICKIMLLKKRNLNKCVPACLPQILFGLLLRLPDSYPSAIGSVGQGGR